MRKKRGFTGLLDIEIWKYADGNVWQATQGRDFFCRPGTFIQRLKKLGDLNGYNVEAYQVGTRKVEFRITKREEEVSYEW